MGTIALLAISMGGLFALAAAARHVLSQKPGSTGPAPSSPEEDATLGTLPQVPHLLEREAKEPGFVREFLRVIKETGADGDRYAALMSEESGFRPDIKNPIGAVGLMQWLPSITHLVGYTAAEIGAMTAIEQMRGPVKATMKLQGVAGRKDPAMAGWGSHVGEPDATVIATKEPPFPPPANSARFYTDNKGYDRDNKGYITAGDVRKAVYGLLDGAALKPRIGPNGKPVTA